MTTYIYSNQKIKTMNKKLLAFRSALILFIVISFLTSWKLETEIDCAIMFFTFLISLGYLGAEMIITRDEAESKA
jgi:diacylglycerol kinase